MALVNVSSICHPDFLSHPVTRSLLEAAVKAVQNPAELVSGRPNVRYPCERQGQRVPLWLRLSNNRIGDGRGSAWVRSFLQNMEHELLPTRRQVVGCG